MTELDAYRALAAARTKEDRQRHDGHTTAARAARDCERLG